MSHHVSNFVCAFPCSTARECCCYGATLDRWRAEIRAQILGKEGLELAAKQFYNANKTVFCAAHVVGITDPSMYLHNRASNQGYEMRNRELKEQRKAAQAEQDKLREMMDPAATKVGHVDDFLQHRDTSDVTDEALYDAQDELAYVRARLSGPHRTIRSTSFAFKLHAQQW